MSEPVYAELHKMHLSRQPCHNEKEYGQQDRCHSEAGHRHCEVLSIKFLKFVFVHGFKLTLG
jgi:hypothetical protein